MSRPPSERRQYPRYEVAGLGGHLVVPIKMEVINLSLGGLALETSSYLQFGRNYSLRLKGESSDLALTGTVAWCALRRTARSAAGEVLPVYRAGLRFDGLSSDKSQRLWDLIRQHALVEIEDSVLGRFRVDLPKDTRLGTSYDFAVRKLSLSGMLIETDFEPAIDSSFQLQLRLGAAPWETRARVASLPKAGRHQLGGLVQVGLQFGKLRSSELDRLRSFLEARLRRPADS